MIKVLFFDDNPWITLPLVESLEKEFGWNGDREITPVCETCQLLNEIYNDEVKYDLFILDVVAPACPNGFTEEEFDDMQFGFYLGLVIAKKIRKMEKYKDVPILYFSAGSLYIPECERENTVFLDKSALKEDISEAMKKLLKINPKA